MSLINYNQDFRYYTSDTRKKVDNTENSDTARQKYLKSMQSSSDQQFQKEQDALQRLKNQKQKVVDFRKSTTYRDDTDKKFMQNNYKEMIDMQVHLKDSKQQEINSFEKQQNKAPFEFWGKVCENHDTDSEYRKQMKRQIQQENNMMAEDRKLKEKQEKYHNQRTNNDQFIDYDKRHNYLF